MFGDWMLSFGLCTVQNTYEDNTLLRRYMIFYEIGQSLRKQPQTIFVLMERED